MTARRGPLAFVLPLIALFLAGTVHGAAFTPGNLVIYRVNDGAAAIGANGTPVFLDEYTTAGALVQSIPVPTTTVGAQRRLVCSGSATTEGFLTLSTNGQYIVFPGYDAAVGTVGITGSTSATVPRVIGRAAANGTLDTSTALTDAINAGNPRGATSTNGTDLWLSGTSAGGGIRYATLGATTSTSISATVTNLRATNIFGGQLYVSSQSGAFRLATVGAGTPTTTGQTITNLPGFPTATGSPYGFFFADLNAGVAGVDTVYVADDGGTIQKYSLVGGNWTANGTIALTTARGITGTVSGSNVTLYVTARTTLRTLTDTSGYNATITGSVATLATAVANTAFQGVAFAPVSALLPNLTINDISLNEGNAGTTSFTFTVSLSAPAGPGGVTFDIATADGTATQPGDYTLKSLTSQTIPAGSSTYSFTVLVNGDTTPETNETFFVNVTNVTGATVTDGQGLGTIQNDDAAPNLTINDVTQNELNAGTSNFSFTVNLSAPAPAGGVTFDIATANNTAVAPGDYTAKTLLAQTIPAGSSTYNFDVVVNGDTTPETDETFFVNVTNVTNAIVLDGQGLGTIVNDDITRIHDVQGNGAATPIPGSTVTVEGVVISNYQGTSKLSGFFLQEEDADADADPSTSEGIFVFCITCPTAVVEGQLVKATGLVSEFNNMTEITASTAPSVVITNAGNNLALVTPSPIDLPIAGVVDDFYEAREGMKVTFVDTLTVSEYFELPRYGQTILYEGGRPRQFTEANPPSVAGNAAQADNLSRRKVIVDDENNAQEWYLTTSSPPGPADGLQYVFLPRANSGFSVGTQGTDFFRGGDLVNGLTGVLHWSFPGFGADTWRIRPTAANPTTFTVANPRPATPPAVGGAIKVVGMNLLNYFTTIDTTASNNTGPCGPGGTLDCRGADSVAELNRQRDRASIVICDLNADVYGFAELENTTPSASITDLLGAVNTRCGGAHPYAFVNTGGTLGTDAIRVQEIYRTGIVSPVGAPLSDLDPVHNRPPTAQTFDVVDAGNPAFGQRFTAVVNHFKSKGCPGTGADADAGDGAGCFNGTRNAQATRLLAWITSTVLPAAGDPDVILLGDFNSYAKEDPVNTLIAGGYTDLETLFHGANAYSYLFDGQLGHLDYGFASASMLPQVTGADAWHINADESDLFDYNDEIKDTGESTFEEKPDGSALAPPRVVFQPSSPYRASDHDPVLLGLFAIADLAVTKTDSPDPVNAGSNLTYTITVNNNGPDAASTASWSDTLPAGTTFVSLPNVSGWSCTTPAVGSGGTVSCSNPSFAVGGAVFTLTVNVAPTVADGTVLSNTATATSATAEGNSGDESDTETTTVAASADLQLSKTDSPDPVSAGSNLTYQLNLTNNGPSNAASATFSDTLPAGTTFVSLSTTGPWSCTTPVVGTTGTVSCTNTSFGVTVDFFTLVVKVDPTVADGTVLSNTATLSSATSDPNGANNSDTATTTVAASADLQITKTDTPDPVNAGNQITYTITVTNAGPSNATSVTLTDTLPAGTTLAFLAAPGAWVCPLPPLSGPVVCTHASLPVGTSVFTLKVIVDPSTAAGTVLTNTAALTAATSDPNTGNESATATTTVAASADLSVTKTDSPDPVTAGNQITYTVTVTNAGPSNATSVTLTDTLPAGTTLAFLAAPGAWVCPLPPLSGPVVCTHASLPVGTSVFTIKVIVDPSTVAGAVLTNTAALTTATSDPNTGNESATATTTVATSADLSVTKTDSPDPVNAGSNISYQLTLTNNGPSNDASTFSDTLPAGTTFVSLSTTGIWSCTTPGVGSTGTVSCTNTSFGVTADFFTLVVKVLPSVPGGTVLSNTATISSSTTDPNGANNSATATTTVATSSDVQVTKVDTPDPVTAGNNLTYTIGLSNAGPSDAAGVTVSDTIPANTTFVSLTTASDFVCTTPAVGGTGAINCSKPTDFLATASMNFTLVVNVNPGTANGTVISNTASIGTTTTDPNGANNSATATTTVGVGSADMSVTKTDTPDPVVAGNNVTYTITVNNAGPSNATTAALADTLPTGTTFVSLSSPGGWSCTTPAVGGVGTVNCSIATLGVTSAVFTLVVNVDSALLANVSNTATASSATTDPNGANNSDTETTTVNTSADVQVTKVDTPDPVTAGTNLTYTITVTNAGPSSAATVALADTVPTGTTFVSLASPGGWSCTTPAVGGTGAINCSIATLAAGGNAVFTLVVAVNPSLTNGTVITNNATASSTTADPNGGNNSATATTTVGTGSANLSVTKVDTPDPIAPGANITYTITVNNAGPTNASSVSLSDTLPANTTFVSLASPGGWSCITPAVGAAGTVTCTNASVGTGNAVFTLVVAVAGNTPNATVISNTATVSSTTADPSTGNESATATTTVHSGPNLVATKSVSGSFLPGGSIAYTIVLTNNGGALQPDNPGNELVDVLPPAVTLVSASATSGTAVATVGTNTVTWNGSLAAGASVTITINATVSPSATVGTTVSNQATINYDADGNGTNESTRQSDSTSAPGASDPTTFAVAPANFSAIPTLDERALMALAVMLAMLALVVMKK
jgi:uncharacterized repeat protein (TIGR01451 family)